MTEANTLSVFDWKLISGDPAGIWRGERNAYRCGDGQRVDSVRYDAIKQRLEVVCAIWARAFAHA